MIPGERTTNWEGTQLRGLCPKECINGLVNYLRSDSNTKATPYGLPALPLHVIPSVRP